MHRMFGLATYDAFSDLKRPVDALVAEGDKVVARWTSTGTHDGPFQGIPPTGKTVTTTGITIFRLEDGKIVEEWSESDMIGHAHAARGDPRSRRGLTAGGRPSDRARSVTSLWSARGRVAGCAAVERGGPR